MASSFQPISIPDIDVIIAINRQQIERFLGRFDEPDNLLNRESLEWTLEFIRRPSVNPDPYPDVFHKGTYLAWNIITRHIFNDGNKRTGMLAGIMILEMNGCAFYADPNEIITISSEAADLTNSSLTYEEFLQWFIDHSNIRDDNN